MLYALYFQRVHTKMKCANFKVGNVCCIQFQSKYSNVFTSKFNASDVSIFVLVLLGDRCLSYIVVVSIEFWPVFLWLTQLFLFLLVPDLVLQQLNCLFFLFLMFYLWCPMMLHYCWKIEVNLLWNNLSCKLRVMA